MALSEAQLRVLSSAAVAHDGCVRVGRPFSGQWGEGRWSGNIGLMRDLEASGLLRFVSLHRCVDRELIRRSALTDAGRRALTPDA